MAAGAWRTVAADLRLYHRLIGMQIRAQAQYRASTIFSAVSYFFVTSLEFAVVFVLFGSFPSLTGWRVGEVALLYATTSFAFGLAELFGAGIDTFPDVIRRGEFDRVLLRPVSALLQVLTNDFRLRRLGRITQGALGFALALTLLPGLHWSAAKVAALALGVLSGAAIFISVLLLGATVCFWTVETTELTSLFYYGGREMTSWPLSIYSEALQRLFVYVLPLAFGAYLPVCYALGNAPPLGLPDAAAFAAPLAAALVALVAWRVWRFGVRHYQSTGS